MAQEPAQGRSQIVRRTLTEILLPALGFGLGVGFATQAYLFSLVTGLAISGTIYVLYRLDLLLVRSHLYRLSRDWARVGLEMAFLLLEHLLGASLALLVCSRLFGLRIVPSAAWLVLAAMVVVVPVIHGTDMALRFYRQMKETERQEEQLRALATQAELTALKAQINPHFLFNTLNTIAQLIHTDSERAEATIERLAEMFRYVLAGSERELVPLNEELAFVNGYLEIERARFGDRLRVSRRVDPQVLHVPVPSLILQPLVENAVRHGQGSDGSIDLALHVEVDAGELVMSVADRGRGMPPSFRLGESAGHGLRNVDERLRKTYRDTRGLEIEDNEPQGTVVRIRMPLGGQA